MPKSKQSWVQSLHLPPQWNLRVADEAVINKVLRLVPEFWFRSSVGLEFLNNCVVGGAKRVREGVPAPRPQQADQTEDQGGEEVLQSYLHGDA